ncbi:MAG: glycerophosphodiester phosphodiesterase [Prosthecobacter sp.]|nr:glycerophosphodiester phosphodiesterase [Prosthecobacter sp.]
MKLFSLFALLIMSTSLSATEIVSHRGFSAQAPENTVSSFKLAWEHGTDACELDLYLTADGEIAILHDSDTKRTTKVAKLVKDCTMAELQTLDAGAWKSAQYKGEKIPTLVQALETMPLGSKRFFLEVKCGPEVVPVLARQLQPWKGRASQVCVIAFDRAVAQESKKAMPWIKVYRLSSEKTKDKKPVDLTQLIADTKVDGLDGLDLGTKFDWSKELVDQVHAAGLELYVWTVNKASDAQHLASLGVDGITTDDPVMLRAALEKK